MPLATRDYRLLDGPPPLEEYLQLRLSAGLTGRTADQARAGLHAAWAACHVVHEPTGRAIGMGRVIGDGGWCFQINDMAVHPDHQRRGLGSAVMERLLERIREQAPAGAVVTLLADPPGVKLYERHGFSPTAKSIGMMRTL